MIDNCTYDKIKLAHKLSCIAWFIEKHAKENAKKAGDKECLAALEQIQKYAEEHAAKLKELVCNC